jgi:hypothetical protein
MESGFWAKAVFAMRIDPTRSRRAQKWLWEMRSTHKDKVSKRDFERELPPKMSGFQGKNRKTRRILKWMFSRRALKKNLLLIKQRQFPIPEINKRHILVVVLRTEIISFIHPRPLKTLRRQTFLEVCAVVAQRMSHKPYEFVA